jgi:hypothetical protein
MLSRIARSAVFEPRLPTDRRAETKAHSIAQKSQSHRSRRKEMIRAIRSYAVAGTVALIGAAMLVSPLAISSGFAQTTTPAAPAPATPAPATPAPMAPAPATPAPMTPATPAPAAPAMPAPATTPPPAAAAPAMKMPEKKKPEAYSRRAVEMVQAALNNKGANLEIDGTMNAATKAALKKYQAGNKLKATGAIDQATLKSLGIKSLKKWE